MSDSTLDIVLIYPELLGLYGDRGNALALRHRAHARGIDARVVEVEAGQPVPTTGDVYLLGGGEDAPMLLAGRLLAEQRGITDVLDGHRPCLAVCAGFQLLSREYTGPDGCTHTGLGVLDVTCGRLEAPRAVGEVRLLADSADWGALTGFENHQGDARLGDGVRPLGTVEAGIGNGHDGIEGAVAHGVLATYLHGPVLVRNPQLADHLLERATGRDLEPLMEPEVDRLRRERLAATGVRRAGRR